MQAAVKFSISTEQAIDDLLATSTQNPTQIYSIFKHSTRCSISSMALNRMEKSTFFDSNQVPFYYLDLIQFRNVSNYLAHVLKIEHESPQIILIKSAKVIGYASHSDIRESWLEEAIKQS